MAYATPNDVANRLGRELDDGETTIVTVRLNDAELILKHRIPDLDDRVNDSQDYHDLVVMVECEMVLRLVRNPDGYSQESDGNYSYAIYQQVASGKLEVLDSEWDLLGVDTGSFAVIEAYLPTPWNKENDPLIPYVPHGQCGDWT